MQAIYESLCELVLVVHAHDVFCVAQQLIGIADESSLERPRILTWLVQNRDHGFRAHSGHIDLMGRKPSRGAFIDRRVFDRSDDIRAVGLKERKRRRNHAPASVGFQLRPISLREDNKSIFRLECHANGLLPFRKNNKKLWIDRHVGL
ncbi:hypothetical protein K458DRAFT_402710 [Lentithecium fluviatile CBS 122367]|uniref:Uncharacterized protein n=1 Tax=Lentithecium fluviatile CBS 122367 TaxID=1168545 RepID=A0A6G1J7K9_9PLEO|nr:hypothetical protein K458DRAFT_402710 [Lentithecium fluviatile CBS 122367]